MSVYQRHTKLSPQQSTIEKVERGATEGAWNEREAALRLFVGQQLSSGTHLRGAEEHAQ